MTGLTKEHIGYENGVLGCVVSALTAFAAPGDAVLLHSPTYIGFTGCIGNNGFKMVHSPLKKDEAGIWRIDFEDMIPKTRQKTLMWQFYAVLIIHADGCGKLRKQWKFTRQMTVL